MKKIIIAIGIYCSLLGQAHAQDSLSLAPKPKTGLKSFKFEDGNFLTSYYQQTGNNSAVTGGIGTEALFDIATGLDVSFSFLDKKQRKNTLNLDAALDYYSSASSDMIDPRNVSSASTEDIHFYPSISWSQKDLTNKNTKGASFAYSTEWDYTSYGGTLSFAQASADNNTELSLKVSSFFDTWEVILPIELRPAGRPAEDQRYKNRNSYALSMGISQVINKNLQLLFTVEPSFQEGLLSTPYHRVYFTDGSLKVEKLPGTRFKLPMSIRANYFMGDKLILRSFYRYYKDDWNMTAHTLNGEAVYKINNFLSITPHYRYNVQTANKYFSAYKTHALSSPFYSSDYDIAGFKSSFFGAGVRMAPPGGVLGIKYIGSLEFRYGHYTRSNGMVADSYTLTLKVK